VVSSSNRSLSPAGTPVPTGYSERILWHVVRSISFVIVVVPAVAAAAAASPGAIVIRGLVCIPRFGCNWNSYGRSLVQDQNSSIKTQYELKL
jgi:hypothetical protein